MQRSLTALFALPLALFLSELRAEFPEPKNNQAEIVPFTTSDKTVQMMHLPPGFKATLFASEPDVQQPIAMCWDEKGRLWIAENYTYSDANERFDMKLKDRILIFEDFDNDGHFDKRTVFDDDLQMLTSIERGFGGVYAMCPPHLLFIPERDGKPAGAPQILLDGFSTTAASRHTFANGLKWGPDGWLYGRIGISSTSWIDVPGTPTEERKPTAGGIWRYHPTRMVYEPYCHGTTNPWGMDWDEHGEMFFINTVIGHFWHGIQGAHFKRMHGEDPYPNIYGLIDQHADHYHWDTGKKWNETGRDATGLTDKLGGGHAHVGMMIYQGTNFPKEYRGKVFTTNLHGHRVNVDRLEREGSGYVGKHEPDFMKTDDLWFRATEIQYGPDGGVYILDWCDVGECHESDGVHRISGRIYKITYGDPVKPKETDLTKLRDEELAQLQLSDNEWLVRMARWELRERKFRGLLTPAGMKAVTELTHQARNTSQRQNALWTLNALGAFPDEQFDAKGIRTRTASSENDEYLEATRIRLGMIDRSGEFIAREFVDDCENTQRLQNMTASESSPYLRLVWATCLQRLPAQARLQAAKGLLSHAEDATDHNLPLMNWFGIRDLPPAELVKLVPDCQIPLLTQFIARRITEDLEKAPGPLNALLILAKETKRDGLSASVLTGMSAALEGWRKAWKPAGWDAFAATLASVKDETVQKHLRDLNVLFGDGRALDEVRAIALDDKAGVEARKAALQTLIEAKSPELRRICEKLLGERSLAVIAVQGLATFDDPAIAETIVKRWRNFYPNEHEAVVSALVSRPSFARVLLNRMGDGMIDRTVISPAQARQIRSFNDVALTKVLTEKWGAARESRDDIKTLVAALKTKLTPEFIARGKPEQGRVFFTAVCATCHKLYGEGASIGPDLTGSGRHDVSYLVENIADPSAVVATDFTLVVVTLKDGRILNGVIAANTGRTITLKMPGQEITVDRNDIVKQEQLPVSLMPEGLLLAMNDEQLANLVSYLMSNGQVPLPSTGTPK